MVSVEAGIDAYGRKDSDCTLVLSADFMEELLHEGRGPDTTFRTWVHESIHARRAFQPQYRSEYVLWRGYEEGLAEGLARLVLRDKAGLDPAESSNDYYVAAYRSLARVAVTNLEELWQSLWSETALGEVRARFGNVVAELCGTPGLTLPDAIRLGGIADQLFQSSRAGAVPNPSVMMTLWRTAFR